MGALPYSATETDLWPLFSRFGTILELIIQRDTQGRSRGCAWLRYGTVDEAQMCIEALTGKYYLGDMSRALQISFADHTSACTHTSSHVLAESLLSRIGSIEPCEPQSPSYNATATPVREASLFPGDPCSIVLSGISNELSVEYVKELLLQFGPLESITKHTNYLAFFKYAFDAERARFTIDGAYRSDLGSLTAKMAPKHGSSPTRRVRKGSN